MDLFHKRFLWFTSHAKFSAIFTIVLFLFSPYRIPSDLRCTFHSGVKFLTQYFASLCLSTSFQITFQFSSVQFSRSVMSDSLQPHESQHARPPCPSPTPGVHPNSCAWSRRYHAAISSSVVPFSSRPQSLHQGLCQ